MEKKHFRCGTIEDILMSPNVDYTVGGKCSECGACCADIIPVSSREIKAIKAYIKRHHVEPVRHVAAGSDILDGVCPFLRYGQAKEEMPHLQRAAGHLQEMDLLAPGRSPSGRHDTDACIDVGGILR